MVSVKKDFYRGKLFSPKTQHIYSLSRNGLSFQLTAVMNNEKDTYCNGILVFGNQLT